VSVVSVPRRLSEAPSASRSARTSRAKKSTRRIRPWAYVIGLSLVVLAMVIVMNDRQSSIAKLQMQLQDAQSSYVASIDQFTKASAPERIVTAAGAMNLTVPQQILIVHEVSLTKPLPQVRFTTAVSAQSRVVVATRETVASPAPTGR